MLLLRAVACAACLLVSAPTLAATEIQFWHALEGVPGATLDRLVARFNASQRDFQVLAHRSGGQDMLQRALAAKPTGRQPHLMLLSELEAADLLATPRAFKPMYEVAAEWGTRFDREQYFPPAASLYADTRGRLLALPFSNATPVLYVNRDLFAKAGLDPDQPPKTWPEMQTVLLALQKASLDCPYATASPSWIHLENLSAWHNEAMASRDNGLSAGRPELIFNNRLLVRHVSLLSAWAKSELLVHAGRPGDAVGHFARGECALLTASSAEYVRLSAAGSFHLGVAPLPYYDDYPNAPFNTLLGGSALWSLAGRPPRDYRGVAHFIQFLATPAVAAEWRAATGFLPASRTAYLADKRTGYYDQQPQQEATIAQVRGSRLAKYARGVRLRHFAEIRAIVDEELVAVWSAGKAPQDALDGAVTRGNAVLRRAGGPAR